MTKTSLVPKSKAKNAYELLSEIATLALAEPKRMRMNLWGGQQHPEDFDEIEEFEMPKCGTVGCIGGWTETLKPTQDAHITLGLDGVQSRDLFHNRALMGAQEQGTPRHAEDVAAHIRAFQKQYARQLKAKKV